MASSRLSPLHALSPARSSPKIPTKSDKAPRQHLVLKEDQAIGQYQVRSFGGAGSASAISLDNWRPIDRIPPDIFSIGAPELLTGSSIGSSEAETSRPKSIARFSAWIKRSGKGLVVRLRRQGTRAANTDYTDIHFNTYSPSISELASSPIIELPTISPRFNSAAYFDTPPVELPSPLSELPGSRLFTELPTIHGLSELEVADTDASASHRDFLESGYVSDIHRNTSGLQIPTRTFSFDQSLKDVSLSPTGTSRTNLSTADTAVGTVEDEIASAQDMLFDVSQPVVRGLTVRGSVRYRCDSHPDFEPASPVEVVRLISKAYGKGIRPASRAMPSPVTTKPVPLRMATETQTDAPTVNRGEDGTEQQRTNVSCNKHKSFKEPPTPLGYPGEQPMSLHPLSTQVRYGLTASKTVYQQDLHLSKACTETHTFTTQVLDIPHPALQQQLEEIKLLLQKSSLRASLGANAYESDSDLQQDAHSVGQVKVLQAAATVPDVTDCEPEQQLCRPSLLETPEKSDSLSNRSSTSTHASKDKVHPPKECLSNGQHHADSPISPLSVKEKLQQLNSVVSHLVPVTPMTPIQALDQHFQHGVGPDAQTDFGKGHTQGSANEEASSRDISPPKDSEQETAALAVGDATTILTTPQDMSVDASTQENIGASHLTKVKYLNDWMDYQRSPAPVEARLIPPLEMLPDEKILAKYKLTRFQNLQIDTNVADQARPQVVFSDFSNGQRTPEETTVLLRTGRAEQKSKGIFQETATMAVSGLAEMVLRSTLWLLRHAGQEPPIPEGHVRVRWTCNCGEHLYDDFVELREGAASALEAILNREKPHPYYTPTSGSRGSQSTFSQTPGSSHPSNSATSWSSRSAGAGPPSWNPSKGTPTTSRTPSYSGHQRFPQLQPQYLLTCVNEARNTPKLTQIALHHKPVETDTGLANAPRDHYALVNRQWYRLLRLRGLTSIEFVQFYVHRNRFADIRKCPDVPPSTATHDYQFTPNDLLPPVGGRYLLHLFKHPQEYDDEVVAYFSIPKKIDRLQHGVGWGVMLTEGFLPERIWLFVLFSFVLFGCVFAVVWTVKEHDIQGAFGVASFLTTLAGMMLGFAQACLG